MKTIKHFFNYLSASFAVLCLTACPGGPTPEPEISLSKYEIEFDYKGGTKNIMVTSTSGDSQASWSITSEIPSFLSIEPMSGKGNTNITVSAGLSQSDVQQTAVITFNNGEETHLRVTQEGNPTLACWAEPVDILGMSNGVVCGMKIGNSCKYYYAALYKKSEVDKMSDSDLVTDIKKKSAKMSYPDYPENSADGKFGTDYKDVFAWYKGITPNTNYVIVTVSYTSQGSQGEVYRTSVATQNDKYQPEVLMSQIIPETTNNGEFWKWTTEMGGYNCKCYLVYACVSENLFDSFQREDNGVVLAWKIHQNRRNLQKDNVFNTTFNSMSNGAKCREFIFPKLTSNAVISDLPRSKTDKYVEVVILAYDSDNFEDAILSGLVTDVKYVVGEEPGNTSINKGEFPNDERLD